MPVVNLTELETILGDTAPISRGHVTVIYWAGSAPYVAVDGDEVVFPAPITVQIFDGAPAMIDLQPTGTVCCARFEVWSYDTNHFIRVFKSIPEVGPVDFAALPTVDPASFAPVEQTPTLIETIDARIAANPADPAAIETAVADYLAENPPTSGVVHTQSVALSSWVIAHSFGRIPNVAVYVGGEQVDTDVTATASVVTVTFATPTAGVAVLN